MISALVKGRIFIDNFLDCDDCRRVIAAFKSMGIKIRFVEKRGKTGVYVYGKGLYGLKPPKSPLYLGNSGTTMRLISGILCAQDFKTKLYGDESLSKRPMKRIIDPLRKMGAVIRGQGNKVQEHPPLIIEGSPLHGISYEMPMASAQVKSSVLLAGLFAQGKTKIREKLKTRDHTERMLELFGADITRRGLNISISGKKELISPGKMFIPGDISSCAFFIVAATLVPGSKLIIRDVGLNPARITLLDLLKRMGAKITVLNEKGLRAFEPYADLLVESSSLKGIEIREEESAYCIDELPVLCVAASVARGLTRIRGAAELRVKETYRIYSMVTNLKKMGSKIRTVRDDLIIQGVRHLRPGTLESYGDHRTAMSMAVAGLITPGETKVKNTSCINKSFPEFMKILKAITELT